METAGPPAPSVRGWRRVVARFRAVLGRITGHPLVVVGVISGLVGLGHAIWVLHHRYLGALDPDEAGYIATSLRYQRSIDLAHPFAFVYQVGATGNGPFVPLLSVLLLIPGSRSPWTVMMIQPVLLVLMCVSVAGIANRLTGSFAAIWTGAAVATLGTVATATQSYWYGLGVAAAMAAGLWALLASDRCRNRWIWVYGFAFGAMLLTRTMAIGYVPAMAIAGLVVAGRDRHSLKRLAGSFGVMLVVAGPWWFVERNSVFSYLVGYGYGPRAGLFGATGLGERIGFRYLRMAEDIGPHWRQVDIVGDIKIWIANPVPLVAIGVLAIGLFKIATHRAEAPESTRSGLALGAAILTGTAALVSTPNNGVWFELPLVVLIFAGAGALLARAHWFWKAVVSLQVVVVGVSTLLMAWWIVEHPTSLPVHEETGLAHYESGFAQYDERYGPGRRSEQPAAAADWRRLSLDVAAEMDRRSAHGEDAVFTVSGNMQLFNSNTLALEAELAGWGPAIEIPDTTVARSTMDEWLTPTAFKGDREVERILVVAIHDKILFTPDAKVRRFLARAEDLGWETWRSYPMPGGGKVLMLRR